MMQTDILVNNSTMVWVESRDNISFVIAVKLSVGKTILGDPVEQNDLKIFAEDLIDGRAKDILHIELIPGEATVLGRPLLAIVNGKW